MKKFQVWAAAVAAGVSLNVVAAPVEMTEGEMSVVVAGAVWTGEVLVETVRENSKWVWNKYVFVTYSCGGASVTCGNPTITEGDTYVRKERK